MAVLDDAGNVARQYAWTPYGEPAAVDDLGSPQPTSTIGHQGLFFYRLDGGVADPALAPGAVGLYYNRNRWYSPRLGRFTSRDPNETAAPIISVTALNGGVHEQNLTQFHPDNHYADAMNSYCYVQSNPLTHIDPLGLEWHHIYPCYLGGAADGPGIFLENHDVFHDTLRKLLGGGKTADQRSRWKALGDVRRNYLTQAAEAAGVDVSSAEWQTALSKAYASAKHGENITRGYIPVKNRFSVPKRSKGKIERLFDAKLPGANKARAIAKGLAVAGAVLDAAVLFNMLDFEDEHFRELVGATVRAKASGALTLWDEAFGLMDFMGITEEPFSAAWAWTEWSEGL